MSATESYADIPTVDILLLGDPDVGKSTFLSRLTLGTHPVSGGSPSDPAPPYALPPVRDAAQPLVFNITLYGRPYRFRVSDTASPVPYRELRPHLVILCYDVARRASLAALPAWRALVETTYNVEERWPVMVLGLKRDLRRAWPTDDARTVDTSCAVEEGEGDGEEERHVMPQEGFAMAQRLRCDRYAECSAVTGELCMQVLEDIARTAAKTTTEKGGRSGTYCTVM